MARLKWSSLFAAQNVYSRLLKVSNAAVEFWPCAGEGSVVCRVTKQEETPQYKQIHADPSFPFAWDVTGIAEISADIV